MSTSTGLSILGNAYVRIRPDTTGFSSEAQSKIGSALGTIATLAKRAAIPLTLAGGAVAYFGVKTAAQMEQAQIAFTNMLGSAQAAGDYLQKLQKFAATTPFQFKDVTTAAQRLMAMGVQAQDVLPYLTAIGDAVSAMGGGADDINRVVLAIGQMTAKGKIQSDEILQLTEAGIPALKILADSYGVTTIQMSAMIQKSQVMSDKAVPALIKGLENGTKSVKGFGGMMAQQSHTLAGLWSNFTDTLAQQLNKATQPFVPDLKKMVAGATPLVAKLLSAGGTALQETIQHGKDAYDWVTKLLDKYDNFRGVADYFQPLTDHLVAFVKALSATNGPLDLVWRGFVHLANGAKDVINFLHPVVTVAGDVLGIFNKLPGPIQTVVLALAGLKVASALTSFSKMAASESKVVGFFGRTGQAVQKFGQTARVQLALADESVSETRAAAGALAAGFEAAMPRASAAVAKGALQIKLAFAEIASSASQASQLAQFKNAELWGTGPVSESLGKLKGDIAGVGAAAASTAKVGIGALKSGFSSLVGLMGGPLGLALMAATFGIGAIMSAIQRHDAAVKQATTDIKSWYDAMDKGGKQGADAADKLAQKQKELADAQAHLSQLQNDQNAVMQQAGRGASAYGAAINAAKGKVADLTTEVNNAKKAHQEELAGMTPLQLAQERLTKAENDLAYARKTNAPTSLAVRSAEDDLANAQHQVALETDRANDSTKTQIQLQQEQATKALAAVDAQRALQFSQLQLSDSIQQYNAGVADGTLKGNALKEAQLQLADQAEQVAQAAADAAAKQAQQNGATDTAAASQAALRKSLQDTADELTGPARDAVQQMIDKLGGTQQQADITAGAVEALGATVTGMPTGHFIDIQAPTAKQMQDIHDLGYATVTLPNGHVVITADTNPAMGEIQDLLNYARQQSILYRATLPDLNGSASGSGRPGLATGGWVRGHGTGTSDSVPIMGSNGEFMVRAAMAAKHADLLEAINAGKVPGYATGGWINVPPGGWYGGQAAVPVNVIDAGYKAGIHALLAASNFGTGGSGGMRDLGRSIAAAMGYAAQFGAIDYIFTRESGWNPYAQNPTSSAYGIPQFLNATWAAYGGKTSNATQQIRDGILYMVNRYGSPNAAAAFWAAHHWYANGTKSALPGWAVVGERGPELVNFGGGETVLSNRDSKAALQGGPAPLVGGDLVLQAAPGASVTNQMETALFELRRLKRGGRR